MIRKNKRVLSLMMICSLIALNSPSFASEKAIETYSMDEFVAMTLENSETLKSLEYQGVTIKDNVRKLNYQSDQLGYYLDDYYEFADMYRSGDYDDLIDMTDSRRMVYYQTLLQQIYMNPDPTFQKQATLEEDFIVYLMMFGDEEPELEKEDKYYNFIKNEVLLEIQADQILSQYENGVKAAESGTEAAMIEQYIQFQELKGLLTLQEQLLSANSNVLASTEKMYEQGLVSRIEYENAVYEFEKSVNSLESFKLDMDTLEMALKNLAGIQVKQEVVFLDFLDDLNTEVASYEAAIYTKKAQKSSTDLINAIMERDLKQTEYNLIQEYIELDEYNDDFEEIKSDLSLFESEVLRIEREIEANVIEAINDIMHQRVSLNYYDAAEQVALNSYNQAKATYEQGLIKETDKDLAYVGYINALIDSYNAERDLKHAYMKFEMLLDNGVQYE